MAWYWQGARNNKQVSHSISWPVVVFMYLECFTVNYVTLLLCRARYYALYPVGNR